MDCVRRWKELAACCGVLGMVCGSPAGAQMGYVPPNFALMQNFVYHTTTIPTAAQLVPKPAGAASAPHSESRTEPASIGGRRGASALAYSSTPEISRSVRQGLIDLLERSSGGDAARKLEGALTRGDLVGQFRGLLPKYGLSPDNFADVFAAYLLLSWEIVSGREPTPTQVRGADEQVRAKLAANQVVGNWTNADKQRAAEELIYRVMLSTGWNQLFLKERDGDKLAALKASVRRGAQDVGMDFDKLRLTDRGFERR